MPKDDVFTAKDIASFGERYEWPASQRLSSSLSSFTDYGKHFPDLAWDAGEYFATSALATTDVIDTYFIYGSGKRRCVTA